MLSRILVVDDDPRVQSAFVRALEKCIRPPLGERTNADFAPRIETVSSFDEAMEKFTSDVGLAVVDVNLGDREPDGIELIARKRASGHRGFACVLTGFSDTKTLARAFVAGADDYLLKPFSPLAGDIDYILSRAAGEIVAGAGLDPEIHGRYLVARGAHEADISTLCELYNRGYPDDKILAAALGLWRN